MKVHIGKQGWLSLEKRGKMTEQFCPYDVDIQGGTKAACGEWCPFFNISEPIRARLSNGDLRDPYRTIDLCNDKRITVDEDNYLEEPPNEN